MGGYFMSGGGGGGAGSNGAGYGGTSTTSFAIGTGSKAFTTQAGLAYLAGARVRLASAADTSNWMEGVVSSYSGSTLTVTVDKTNGSGTHADWNISLAGEPGAAGASGESKAGYRYGLLLSRNGADTANDITVSTGNARDKNDLVDMQLQSAITKRLDAAWAAGTNQGGLDTGTRANNTWYYVYVIKQTSPGTTVDVILSTQSAGSLVTMPSGYSHYRLIGAIRTGASLLDDVTQIYIGDQIWCIYNDPATNGLDIDVTNQGTTAVGYTLPRLPFNGNEASTFNSMMEVQAQVSIDHASTNSIVYFRAGSVTNSAPSTTAAPLAAIKMFSSTEDNTQLMRLFAQVGSQHIAARSNNASTTLKLQVLGYSWPKSV